MNIIGDIAGFDMTHKGNTISASRHADRYMFVRASNHSCVLFITNEELEQFTTLENLFYYCNNILKQMHERKQADKQ